MELVRLAVLIAIAAAAGGCASSGARPRPFPGSPEPPPAHADEPIPGTVDPALIVRRALTLRGTPYRNGGSDPKGFDCSGFVQYVFAREGVAVPREVREQVRLGREVRLAGIEPADLIFFKISGNEPSHVGISIGGDEFVHAPSSRGVVRVEKFSAVYWSRRIVAVKRVTRR
jgi:cell wall-associated NlpC family hydrolase